MGSDRPNNDTLATKQDVKEIVGQAVDELSGVIRDLAGNVGREFNQVHAEIDELKTDVGDLKFGQQRIERKLDQTVERVDDHSVRLKKVEESQR